ncbi:MAG: peptidoglycan-binding protein, partial [Methylococcaceae bacterium]|nr:peptidoglycan-binding protein [Methylococcaceae bacterium]
MLLDIPISRAENKPTSPAPAASSSPAPQPATALASGIQSLLKEGVHPKLRWGQFSDYQAQLEALYQPSGYSPLWTQDGKTIPQAQKAIASLASADAKGLDSADYDAELLKRWLGEINRKTPDNPQELASFDVALSLSLMRYASNLYMGRINPRRVHFGLDIEPKKEDLPALLRKLATGNSPDPVLAELEPALKLYEYLKNALTHYQQLAQDMPIAPTINLPAKFKPGASHPDVLALRKLLFTLGDLTVGDPNDSSPIYDKDLAEAVERFQSRHGLTEDGIIGKTTLSQLLVPLSERIKQIQLGLERLRWLPDHIDGRYLMVNIPSFQLYGFHNGSGSEHADLEMNVIVGEAINGRNTPVFHSDMTYVNFRPYWNVPYSIAVKEYLPIASRNPGYLSSHNLEIVSNSDPH